MFRSLALVVLFCSVAQASSGHLEFFAKDEFFVSESQGAADTETYVFTFQASPTARLRTVIEEDDTLLTFAAHATPELSNLTEAIAQGVQVKMWFAVPLSQADQVTGVRPYPPLIQGHVDWYEVHILYADKEPGVGESYGIRIEGYSTPEPTGLALAGLAFLGVVIKRSGRRRRTV